MKKWLELDRWNRQYRKIGLQKNIKWQTNEIPEEMGKRVLWEPIKSDIILSEIIPSIEMLGFFANTFPELNDLYLKLMSWIREQGNDPDLGTSLCNVIIINQFKENLKALLEANPSANIGIFFNVTIKSSGGYVLEVILGPSPTTWSKHDFSDLDEIREYGLDIEFDQDSRSISVKEISSRWLAEKNCHFIKKVDNIFLLKNL